LGTGRGPKKFEHAWTGDPPVRMETWLTPKKYGSLPPVTMPNSVTLGQTYKRNYEDPQKLFTPSFSPLTFQGDSRSLEPTQFDQLRLSISHP